MVLPAILIGIVVCLWAVPRLSLRRKNVVLSPRAEEYSVKVVRWDCCGLITEVSRTRRLFALYVFLLRIRTLKKHKYDLFSAAYSLDRSRVFSDSPRSMAVTFALCFD